MPESSSFRHTFLGALTVEAASAALISRRAFVAGSSAAVLAAGSPVAWAGRSHQRDVHGELLDDAAMLWKRVPGSWQEGPFLGNGYMAAHLYRKPGRTTSCAS